MVVCLLSCVPYLVELSRIITENITGPINVYKKLSYRREAARCFVSLNILLTRSKSLEVIRNDTLEYGMCKSLLVFHCNCVSISQRF